MKFWDLQSVEFEKIDHMTSHRKQVLQNIFMKDSSLQLYILYVCEFSRNHLKDIMKLTTRGIVDSLRKYMQTTLMTSTNVLSQAKYEILFKKEGKKGDASPTYNDRNEYRKSGSRESNY
jgi:hypothetical protein